MMKFRREYRRIRLDVSDADEMMLRQRLEFGLRNLDLAFRLYCWCRENSSNPQDPYEYKRFFVRELVRRRVHHYFQIVIQIQMMHASHTMIVNRLYVFIIQMKILIRNKCFLLFLYIINE